MRTRVSYVSPSCIVFIQPQPGVVKWLEQELMSLRTLPTQPVVSFELSSTMYLAYCSGLEFCSQAKNPADSSDTNKKMQRLCRVIIKQVISTQANHNGTSHSNKKLFEIFCVDYGNTLKVSADKLKTLPSCAARLAKLPYQVCSY
jgi:hypothetical protein